jgi:hypothetical protein
MSLLAFLTVFSCCYLHLHAMVDGGSETDPGERLHWIYHGEVEPAEELYDIIHS